MPKRIPQPPSKHKRFKALSDPQEIASLLSAIDGYKGAFVVKCAMKLGTLLMVRPNELRHAEWAEIDFVEENWIIPAHKMKARGPHIVPLSHQAIAILRELRAITGHSRYLFASPKSADRCIGAGAINFALNRMGMEITAYGLRHMAAGILYEVLSFSAEVIRCQLGYATGRQMKYLGGWPKYFDERREMMQKLGDYLDVVKETANRPMEI
ncbi:tyrosine-type recombinase/integrase [Geomonas azotofigens]|uniref:tyrosine-type recombinase/integrase n=1 Tax=Geomonas azotofigens TaxID=2843196 RepID=UPI001C110213|nr:site-specific integrase [Geomonas azotofigens]MBU5613919.1 site-specific integrase [Geomonas azotofigens]